MIPRRDPFDEFAVLIRGETATALGQAGRALQVALNELATFDRERPALRSRTRDALVGKAGDALYAYVIQKELNGIPDDEMIKKVFDILQEVWQQMGVTGQKRS